jgi:hypothetical protein
LTTLIVEIPSMCVRGDVRGKGIGYPIGADAPFQEILMKRKLNLALWIVAGILAVVFLVASSTRLFVPKEKLAGMGGAASRWVEDFSPFGSGRFAGHNPYRQRASRSAIGCTTDPAGACRIARTIIGAPAACPTA